MGVRQVVGSLGGRRRWALAGIAAFALAFPAAVLADAPTADNKPSESTTEDSATQITLSGGDADGDNLTFVIGTGPTHGSLSNFGSPQCDSQTPSSCTETVDYTPNANFHGSDGFTYHTNDGSADSGNATVSISVTAVNDQPVAAAKTPTTAEDTFVQVTMSGTDIDGDDLTFSIVASPSNGSLGTFGSPSCNGQTPSSCTETVRYTPDADYNGGDTFTYRVNDGTVNSIAATVSVTITAVNDAPSFTIGADETVNEDSGAASFPGWATNPSPGPPNESTQTTSYLVSSNTNSALFSTAPAVAANGTLTFTVASNRFGTATVGVEIKDTGGTSPGIDTSAEQTFTITVNPVDDPPNAANDLNLPVSQGSGTVPTPLDVLANDSYLPDGPETILITAVTQGTHGTVAITGGGTGLTYTPANLYIGPDQFSYTIQDSGGTPTDQAQVTVNVANDVTAPITNSVIQTLPTGVTMGTTVPVKIAWSATDGTGVGVASYQLQQSLDGGTFTTISLPTPTTTSSTRGLSAGHTYKFRMRATDKNGNVSAYRNGSTFTVARYQDNSSVVHYGGTWGSVSSTSYSGGTMHYAGTAGKTATLTTTGRDFAIVGPKSSTRGTFQVYVDGVLNATVSETRTTTLYRQVLWSVHFGTSASHQIQIKVVGPARIDLDCFLVLR
jgi:Bacterial Ig domain